MYEKIPLQMRQQKRWCCFKIKEITNADGTIRRSKIPVRAFDLRYGASTSNPNTWSDFATVVSSVGQMSSAFDECSPIRGIGFMLGDGWAGVDLDKGPGHQTEGFTEDLLKDVHDTLKTYAEISYSGNGYHFIGRYSGEGFLYSKSVDGSIQLYTDKRFFVMTGNQWGDHSNTVEITEELGDIYQRYIARQEEEKSVRKGNPPTNTVMSTTITGDRKAIGNYVTGLNKDPLLYKLVQGQEQCLKKYSNPSAYDMAFMLRIVYWVGENPAACIRLFRESKYALEVRQDPDKLLRDDYMLRTYQSAVEYRKGYQAKR